MLKIENFSKTYPGGNRAVDHLSLEVRPGDVFGFIGHNGAGKTTTIRAITGVMDFSEGNIWVDGESVRRHHGRDGFFRGQHLGGRGIRARKPAGLQAQNRLCAG